MRYHRRRVLHHGGKPHETVHERARVRKNEVRTSTGPDLCSLWDTPAKFRFLAVWPIFFGNFSE